MEISDTLLEGNINSESHQIDPDKTPHSAPNAVQRLMVQVDAAY